jgi:flagellar hook-associated protein FlgK
MVHGGSDSASSSLLLTMGAISDSFKATLDAIKKQDEISQAKTKELLQDINRLIDTLEAIDLED